MSPKNRNVADFPKATDEGIDVTADLSGEAYAHVINKHPEMHYRFASLENKSQWERVGYLDNPPGLDGPAMVRQKTKDVVLMACHKSVHEARKAKRTERSHKLQEKISNIANAKTNETVGRAGTVRGSPPQKE